MTTSRPVLLPGLWASSVAAVAEQLRSEGMSAGKAFARALEICRPEGAVLVSEDIRDAAKRKPSKPRKRTVYDRMLLLLAETGPLGRWEIAERLRANFWTVVDATKNGARLGTVVEHGTRITPGGGPPQKLWRLA